MNWRDYLTGIVHVISYPNVWGANEQVKHMHCGLRVYVTEQGTCYQDLGELKGILKPWIRTNDAPTCLACVAAEGVHAED